MRVKESRPDRCCRQVAHGTRSQIFLQCRRKWTVKRDGERYCAQHDPERKRAKDAEWSDRYDASRRIDDERERTARKLGRRLGCKDAVCAEHISFAGRVDHAAPHTLRRVSISFEDAERIAARLKGK